MMEGRLGEGGGAVVRARDRRSVKPLTVGAWPPSTRCSGGEQRRSRSSTRQLTVQHCRPRADRPGGRVDDAAGMHLGDQPGYGKHAQAVLIRNLSCRSTPLRTQASIAGILSRADGPRGHHHRNRPAPLGYPADGYELSKMAIFNRLLSAREASGKSWAKVFLHRITEANQKGPVSRAFIIARAGFEPATSGL